MRNRDILSWNQGTSSILTLLSVTVILAAACDRGPNHRGWDYFPDMFYSPAYPTWSENTAFTDSATMQPPVAGTVPRHMVPFQYQRTDQDRERAGRELANPLTADAFNTARGQKVYDVYCMICHGERGDGQGYLFTSGKYLVPPASLVDANVADQPDGMIYHTISVGFGIMAEYATLIRPEDRWRSIIYIRQELQGAGN
jgi:mono/diheme cytochrome c family protein